MMIYKTYLNLIGAKPLPLQSFVGLGPRLLLYISGRHYFKVDMLVLIIAPQFSLLIQDIYMT